MHHVVQVKKIKIYTLIEQSTILIENQPMLSYPTTAILTIMFILEAIFYIAL